MENTTAIIASLGIATATAIGYMIYDGQRKKTALITSDFARDDQAMYTLMRQELIAHLGSKYGSWFDDGVSGHYNSGAMIGGKPSKTAAFMRAWDDVKNFPDYKAKNSRFQSLYKNLKSRYQ